MLSRIGRLGSIDLSSVVKKSTSGSKQPVTTRSAGLFPAATPSKSVLLDSLKNTLQAGQLEKHISDVRVGQGNLSAETGATLVEFRNRTSQNLASSDPSSLRNYSAYMSAFGYDKNARFINGVEGASQASISVQKADDNADEFQKEIERIFAKKEDAPPTSELPAQPAIDVVA